MNWNGLQQRVTLLVSYNEINQLKRVPHDLSIVKHGKHKSLGEHGKSCNRGAGKYLVGAGLGKLLTGAIKTQEIISSAREKMQVVLMARRGNAANTRRR